MEEIKKSDIMPLLAKWQARSFYKASGCAKVADCRCELYEGELLKHDVLLSLAMFGSSETESGFMADWAALESDARGWIYGSVFLREERETESLFMGADCISTHTLSLNRGDFHPRPTVKWS